MEVITEQPQWFKDALSRDHRDDFIEVDKEDKNSENS